MNLSAIRELPRRSRDRQQISRQQGRAGIQAVSHRQTRTRRGGGGLSGPEKTGRCGRADQTSVVLVRAARAANRPRRGDRLVEQGSRREEARK